MVVERKKKRKGGKQLLSFGDEEGDAEEVPVLKKTKFDTRIVMDMQEEEPAQTKTKPKKAKTKENKSRDARWDACRHVLAVIEQTRVSRLRLDVGQFSSSSFCFLLLGNDVDGRDTMLGTLKNAARAARVNVNVAQRATAVRRFHPLAGQWDDARNPVTGNLVPMVIEQTVRLRYLCCRRQV